MKPSKVLRASIKPDGGNSDKRRRLSYTPEERAQRKAAVAELAEQKRALAALKRIGKTGIADAKKTMNGAARELRNLEKSYVKELNAQQRVVNGVVLALEKIAAAAQKRL